MWKEFVPKNHKQELFHKLHNVRQNSSTVQEYTWEFFNLCTRLNSVEEEDVRHYLKSLQQHIQGRLTILNS